MVEKYVLLVRTGQIQNRSGCYLAPSIKRTNLSSYPRQQEIIQHLETVKTNLSRCGMWMFIMSNPGVNRLQTASC